ncbi:MAG: hypothetical protein H6708_26645 [Kofleriaceae bacterium]|nr:hypothetical protein [Myxococcales bacterium]MCB9563990.1 hypothetical protein [Kofleriaceae bacterium]
MTTPEYIQRGGDLVMAQPLELKDATMYSFLVGADLDALTKICDAQLNAVTGGATVYKPMLPMATVVCADIAKSYSLTPPDSTKGWMAERDFGIWVPLVAGTMDGGTFKPDRLVWYLPYVFVDNVAAMVTGRDVFGFFKQTATLTMPATPTTEGAFTADALVIQTFSPDAQAQTLQLLEVTSTAGVPSPGGGWTSPVKAIEALLGDLKRLFFDVVDTALLPLSDWKMVETLLKDAVEGLVPMVFLKQYRDATDPGRACYQAVIEAPAKLQAWHDGGLCHPHDVVITPCDSHPIVAECGLAGPTVRSELGFWTRIDFVMEAGQVIAQRP